MLEFVAKFNKTDSVANKNRTERVLNETAQIVVGTFAAKPTTTLCFYCDTQSRSVSWNNKESNTVRYIPLCCIMLQYKWVYGFLIGILVKKIVDIKAIKIRDYYENLIQSIQKSEFWG